MTVEESTKAGGDRRRRKREDSPPPGDLPPPPPQPSSGGEGGGAPIPPRGAPIPPTQGEVQAVQSVQGAQGAREEVQESKRRKISAGAGVRGRSRPMSVKELFKVMEERKARVQDCIQPEANLAGVQGHSFQGGRPSANEKMVRQHSDQSESSRATSQKKMTDDLIVRRF